MNFFKVIGCCLGLLSLLGCDLQPKIVSIPDNVGDFISERYPTLLADPETQPEIYNSAVTDYGMYASPELYGCGDITTQDYILYSGVDDYVMPNQTPEYVEQGVVYVDENTETPVEKEIDNNPDTPDIEPEIEYLSVPMYGAPDGYVQEVIIAKTENEKINTDKPVSVKTEKVPEKKIEIKNSDEKKRVDLKEIVVVQGDTLYSISRKYSIPVNDLAVINDLNSPFTLSVGQKIKVPDLLTVPVKIASSDKIENKVEKVENKSQIKKQNDIKKEEKTQKEQESKQKTISNVKTNTQQINKTNNVVNTKLAEQKVEKSVTKKSTSVQSNTKKQTKTEKTTVKNVNTKKTDTKKNETKKVPETEKKKISSDPNQKLPKIAARSSSKFSWPVRGKILSGYGSKSNGLFNDGINIQANKGTNVMAAENGVVAYAGNEIKGMGNLIIIQHADGWMTVYAHMNTMSVKRGNKVNVGQKIGTVGMTGKVDAPQLHFEIRKGTKSYNPTQYLKK